MLTLTVLWFMCAPSVGQELAAVPRLVPADETLEDNYVPVRFHSRITELGVLELWCVSTINEKRWKLEFSVREDAEA